MCISAVNGPETFVPVLVPVETAGVRCLSQLRRRGESAEKPVKQGVLVVPVERIELPPFGLQNRCSTAELNRQAFESLEETMVA